MKKGLTIALLMAFGLAVVGAVAVTAGTTQNPDGTMTIDQPAEKFPAKKLNKDGTKKKPPVTWTHKDHGERLGCVACHHTQEEAKLKDGSEAAKGCFSCHGPEDKAVEGKTQVDTYKMFHDKKVGKCKVCHDKEKAAGKKVPGCKDCHPK